MPAQLGPLRWILICLTVLVPGMVPNHAYARNVATWDLDSLAMFGQSIFIGTIRNYVTEGGPYHLVDVEQTFRGAQKKGELVKVVGLDRFDKPDFTADLARTLKLAVGDRVILFTGEVWLLGFNGIPNDGSYIQPIDDGGIKWIDENKVIDSIQGFWPSGFKREQTGLDLAKFLVRLDQGLQRTTRLKTELLPRNNDLPWLLDKVRERHKEYEAHEVSGDNDQLLLRLCSEIAKTHDLETIWSALKLTNNYSARIALTAGLGTRKGREFLFQQIADRSQSMERRIQLLGYLQGAGLVYDVTKELDPLSDRPAKQTGAPTQENGALLRRLARLAQSHVDEPTFCVVLMNTIRTERMRGVDQDLNLALEILRDVYQATSSPLIKFRYEEQTYRADPVAYAALQSPCGKEMTSIVYSAQLVGGRLQIDYARCGISTLACTAQVVIESVDTPGIQMIRRWEGGENSHQSMRGSFFMGLTKPLPPGTYRAYLRSLGASGGIVSDGYACTFSL